MCTVSNNIETSTLSYYTCPHSFTPKASKAQIRQRCGRDYSKETGISRQHSAARRRNGANRKTRQNNIVTSRQYGRHAVYVSGDVRFQDGDAFDLGTLGGGTFSFIFFYCYSMSALALAYIAIRYTHWTTVLLWYNGLCDIGVLLMYDASQCGWRISPIRLSNVRPSPLICIPNMSGLLRPRVIKPLHYPRLS